MTVNGAIAPILDTADGSLGLSVNSQEISTIPLNGRNFSSVTLFQPGAVATDPTGLTGNNAIERSTFNSDVVTINGNRAQANNYTLDGTDINETQNNLIGYNVAPDAIQELRVVQANAPANLRQRQWRRCCHHSEERHKHLSRQSLRKHREPESDRKYLGKQLFRCAAEPVYPIHFRRDDRRPDSQEQAVLLRRL